MEMNLNYSKRPALYYTADLCAKNKSVIQLSIK